MPKDLSAPAARLRRSPIALFIAMLLPVQFAQAQTESSSELSEVVVTASGFEQDVRLAPASISVVTREELETKQYRDLGEALQDVPGIDVLGGTGKAGGLDINIRGMGNDYTLILIDGRRQNAAGDVTPNGFGNALNSLIPPISAIERIEVVRGPMSTLYGSDAMGGVVNIITRKVAKSWTGSIGVEGGFAQAGDEGDQRKLNLYASGPIKTDVLGLQLRGNIYRRNASERAIEGGSGRDPRPGESKQYNLGAKLMLTPTKDHDIWLDVEQARTSYDNSDCRLGTLDHVTCATGAYNSAMSSVSGYTDTLRFNRDQAALGHTSRLGWGQWESSLMYNVTETKGRTIPYAARSGGDPEIGTARKLETTSVVADTKLVAPVGDQHVLTTGGQWWETDLEDGLLYEDHSQKMWALFLEDEWKFARDWALTLGGRYNHHDAFSGEFTPRAYLVWQTTPNWTVKGGVSRGYKAPSVNQLIDGVSGIGRQGANISIGNPNLKPEISTNSELGVLYASPAGLSGSATVFHNKIKDKIASGGSCATEWISSCSANRTGTYNINHDEAKTYGLELAGTIPIVDRWSLKLGYTWTDTELQSATSKSKLSDTPKHAGNVRLNWQTTDKLNLWLQGQYRGKSRRFNNAYSAMSDAEKAEYDAVGDLKAYTLFNLGGSYKYDKRVTFNANIYNLLNKDFNDYASWIDEDGNTQVSSRYYQGGQSIKGTALPGRTFWISANVTF